MTSGWKMKVKEKMKSITLFVSVMYLVLLTGYGSILIGMLAHELMHQRYSINMKAIEVNYDGSGAAYGSFYKHSHDYVYLVGWVVQSVLMTLTAISLIVISNSGCKHQA